eukprot:gnl/TRDRNA2_/TRDRNA2_180173_c0_seq1.p1 gnl/TRDRNA2_/TRDRNA2_180173_c0~~gnl/TRDRNA2_/TRDRNA2_180173_c0_seq1.p1  ORF type:complete len:276 (+),score=36.65 gnl/TRDRNA2_/TRDRNA2_180173_c0_seq1:91-918(+)
MAMDYAAGIRAFETQAAAGVTRNPNPHPLWQGSVPDKWMDQGSGYPRGPSIVCGPMRNGKDGVAAQGFGGYMTDHVGKRREETKELRCSKSAPVLMDASTWHQREFKWKPSRRQGHHWHQGPGPGAVREHDHAGLEYRGEPSKITKRPPFVKRDGNYVLHKQAEGLPPIYDAEIEKFHQKKQQDTYYDMKRKAIREDRAERRQVKNLENWERSHLIPSTGPAAAVRKEHAKSALYLGLHDLTASMSPLQKLDGKPDVWADSDHQFVRRYPKVYGQ